MNNTAYNVEHLQLNSLAAFLASLSSAVGIFAFSVLFFIVVNSCLGLFVVTHTRRFLLSNTIAKPLGRNLLGALPSLLRDTEQTLLHDCGIEAVLFLQFLRFLFAVFGILTVTVTPAVACFNYFVIRRGEPLDPLNALSWSNLSPNDARVYWFYAVLQPITVAFMLFMISRILSQTLHTRKGLLKTRLSSPHQESRKFFVAAKNVPSNWDESEIHHFYSKWKQHILRTQIFSQDGLNLTLKSEARAVIEKIEHCEAIFIKDTLERGKRLARTDWNGYLAQRIKERYTKRAHSLYDSYPSLSCWAGSRVPVTPLYAELGKLMLVLAKGERSSKPRRSYSSVILTIDDYHVARAIEDYPISNDIDLCRTQFLGSSLSHVVLSHVASGWMETRVRQIFVQTLVCGMIVGWTIPMASVGGLSQLTTVLRLMAGEGYTEPPAWLLGVVQGAMPSLATTVLLLVFQWLLDKILVQAKFSTMIELQLSLQNNYTSFLIVQLFLVPSVTSGLIPSIFQILRKGIAELPKILAQNLPLAGNYYLSYILIQGFLLVGKTLLRPQLFVVYYWTAKRAVTPRSKLYAMRALLYEIQWGQVYPYYSTLVTIVITYSLLTPLILPIATITFLIAQICLRYILLYLSDIKLDTEGRSCLQAIFRLFWGLYLQLLTHIGLFVLKFRLANIRQDIGQIMLLSLTLFACIQYHIHLEKLYRPIVQHQEGTVTGVNGQVKHSEQPLHIECSHVEQIFNRFIELDADVNDFSICLPRDSMGISKAIIHEVQSKFLSNGARIIDCFADLSDEGQVVLRENKENSIELQTRSG